MTRGVTPADGRETSRLNMVVAVAAITLSLLMPPVAYFTIAYTYLQSDIYGDARVAAEAVQPLVTEIPLSWTAQKERIEAIVSRHYHFDTADHPERLQVMDDSGRIVASLGPQAEWPAVAHVAPLLDSAGTRTGTVEIQRSLLPLLMMTGLMAVFGLVLAVISFVALRVIPTRSLVRKNEALRLRDAELAFANTLLTAATEGSLDAILIVDNKEHIVSYNKKFADLWRLPADLLAAGDEVPVLQAVLSGIRDPDAFRARVRYLYEHPEEEARDRIEMADGRVLDRYTRTLHEPQGQYLGRIWFFRDITEQETAAQSLKDSEALFRTIFDNAIDGISLADAATRQFFLANKSFCDMLGYEPREVPTLAVDRIRPSGALVVVLDTSRQSRREIGLAGAPGAAQGRIGLLRRREFRSGARAAPAARRCRCTTAIPRSS